MGTSLQILVNCTSNLKVAGDFVMLKKKYFPVARDNVPLGGLFNFSRIYDSEEPNSEMNLGDILHL